MERTTEFAVDEVMMEVATDRLMATLEQLETAIPTVMRWVRKTRWLTETGESGKWMWRQRKKGSVVRTEDGGVERNGEWSETAAGVVAWREEADSHHTTSQRQTAQTKEC